MKTYVAGLYFKPAVVSGAAVLLIRKLKPAWMKGRLNAIGGKVELAEPPPDAMVREFHEETGLVVPAGRWAHFLTLQGKQPDGEDFEVHFYRADRHFGDLDPKSMTEEVVSFVPVESVHELPNWFLPNLAWIVPMSDEKQKRDWPFVVTERAGRDPRESARA